LETAPERLDWPPFVINAKKYSLVKADFRQCLVVTGKHVSTHWNTCKLLFGSLFHVLLFQM